MTLNTACSGKKKNRGGFNYLIMFLLSLISIKGLSLSLPTKNVSSFQRLQPKSFIWVFIFFALWTGLSIASSSFDRKSKITAGKLTLFYSLCNILGYFFKNWGGITFFWTGINDSINFFCYIVGCGCVLYCFILFIIRIFQKVSSITADGQLYSNQCVLFILTTVILLVAWVPWFLHLAPVITTPDSDNQIRQVMGDIPLSDNHPVFHTLWIKLIFTIAGNPQKGAILYSICQILFNASAFALCVCFIDTNLKRKFVTIAALIWFAVYPVYPIYGITMWKDIPFAICLLLIVLNIINILKNDNENRSALHLILNPILFLVLCFLRHNGILVFIPTAVVIISQLKKNRKSYIALCLLTIVIYLIFQYLAVPMLNIKAGRSSEGFSIPLQQIARVAVKYPNEITEPQKATLSLYFNEDLEKIYRPTLSDKVKAAFDEEVFAANPKPIIRLWLDLGKAHPLDYLESILHNSYGFWYLDEEHVTFFFGLDSSGLYGIHESPLIHFSFMQKFQNYLQNMKYYSVPIICWVFTPAFGAWILFLVWIYCRDTKNKVWIALVPLLSLWIQMFGSPAYCEFRYIYGLFTCLPLILCCPFLSISQANNIDVLLS